MKQILPPEWAPQWGVMLTWPQPDGDFADVFAEVEQNFIGIVAAIARFERVLIGHHGDPAKLQKRLAAAGVLPSKLHIVDLPSNDVWARDHGPITVLRGGKPLHLDFQFNGWGGKFDASLDNEVTQRLVQDGALPAPIESVDFILEGGGIEVDGHGTLLTTERCLLAPTRNPRFGKADIEGKLKNWFGLTRVLWLKYGDLMGDDTDGHIDTIARFCDAGTIAYQACDDRADAHYEDLRAMAEELTAFRRSDGRPYQLIPLPLPKPIHDRHGKRLPAGYANFLIVNRAVLVPTYGDENDAVALKRLQPAFRDRAVIGVDCRALINQYGSLHCVTMQIPQ
jgi:agmatine/peptidylarginine deiminase